ncbi:MAG: hypothetical protein K9N07_05430 [Candidatus Cloacimonetes bacterium]|nr:hypothetical protein [Candidatus Cloacimonadota bacterium]
MYKTIFISIFFILMCHLNAQKLIKHIDIVKTADNITDIYQNENTGEIFRHYSNKMDLKLGLVSELLEENVQEGIIWENGKKVPFSKGEHLLASNNDYILTIKNTWDTNKEIFVNEVRKYTIIGRALLEADAKLKVPKDHEITMLITVILLS